MKAILDSLTKLLFGGDLEQRSLFLCLEAMEHFDGKENQFEKDLSKGVEKPPIVKVNVTKKTKLTGPWLNPLQFCPCGREVKQNNQRKVGWCHYISTRR